MGEKKKSIPEQLEAIQGRICDDYCKWPDLCNTEEELMVEHCDNDCPVMQLLE